MTDSLENRPDEPGDHIAPAAGPDVTARTDGAALADAQTHPWARYWAKMLDMGAFIVVIGLVLLTARWDGRGADIVAWCAWVALFPLVEAFSIARTCGTPGKALFGISVTDPDARRLDLRRSITRSYLAMLMGGGLCVPVVSFAANALGYRDYRMRGLTRWDRRAGAIYRARPTAKSWIVLCIIGLVIFMLAFLAAAAAVMQG